MISAVHMIEQYGIPINSWVAATLSAKGMDPSTKRARKMVHEITGDDTVDLQDEHAVYTFYYTVQNAIKTHLAGTPLEGPDLLSKSANEAAVMLHRLTEGDMAFARAEIEEEFELSEEGEMVSKLGKPKRMNKGHLAAQLYQDHFQEKTRFEIIELFMVELDTTKAGATAQYHNMSKLYGQAKPSATSSSGGTETKKQVAIRVYDKDKTRSEMIDILIDTLDTTKAGANTYYNECIRAHGTTDSGPAKAKKQTKSQLAAAIFAESPGLTKDEYIKLFAEKLNTSPAGASTYYYNAKKSL